MATFSCQRTTHTYRCPEDAEILSLTNIIRIPPLETHLQIVITENRVMQLLQQIVALIFRQFVDILRKRPNGINALPSRYRVGPHERMNGRQVPSYILRRPSGLVVHCGLPGIHCFDEPITDERCGQSLEELLVRLAEQVVDVVSRRPQCVASCRGKLYKAQTRVICWTLLELDVAMPSGRVVAMLVFGLGAEELLSLQGGDGTDRVVAIAELGRSVQNGVDV
jgi:hypothetical protein